MCNMLSSFRRASDLAAGISFEYIDGTEVPLTEIVTSRDDGNLVTCNTWGCPLLCSARAPISTFDSDVSAHKTFLGIKVGCNLFQRITKFVHPGIYLLELSLIFFYITEMNAPGKQNNGNQISMRSCRFRLSWTSPWNTSYITMRIRDTYFSTNEPMLQLTFLNSPRLQHALHRTKRRLREGMTPIVILISLLFILIFLLGAESSLYEEALSPESVSYTFLTREKDLCPVYRQLHRFHSVPNRYLRLMTPQQQLDLFLMMSTAPSNSVLATPSRRAVFVHVTKCNLHPCLRAIASAITYARVTHRVAVVFVDTVDGIDILEWLELSATGAMKDEAILIPLKVPMLDFHGENQTVVNDWAEFTVIHAVAPNSLTDMNASMEPGDISDSRAPAQDYFETLPRIGNTEDVATLDNLAALDTHVSLSLSEVVWSRYAPRTLQEGLFQDNLRPRFTIPPHVISRASILGRHRATKNIKRTESILYRDYNIPEMLWRGMGELERKLLLLKLESKMRRGVKNPRIILVHAQYGLGNRLRALGSAMAFARRTGRVLVLIWVPDQHLNCRFTDLFVASDEFVVSNSFAPGEEWPFVTNKKKDQKMKNVKWYNFMRVNGVKVTSSEQPVLDDPERHIYVSTCYVIQSPVTPFIIRTTSSYWQVLRTLSPHVDVVRLVERFSSYPLSGMIGIHIRGKSIKTDISGVNATDYSEESSRTTDYWRNLTKVDTFVEEMRKQTADQLFYVAADQKEIFTKLEHEFPSRIFYTPRHCDSRDRDCLPFALADILLLAKCASLRGSYWSSFSELSTRIGGARFLLAGIDFGRP
ncbi:unnamed protein product [Agarophyton chilense]